jgi:hypothetical protein
MTLSVPRFARRRGSRFLSLSLAAAFLASLAVTTPAFASGDDGPLQSLDGFTYRIHDTTGDIDHPDDQDNPYVREWAELISYSGDLATVIIPETLEHSDGNGWRDVAQINANIFEGNPTTITTVYVGAAVKRIQADAFSGQNSITKVYFQGAAPTLEGTHPLGDTAHLTVYWPHGAERFAVDPDGDENFPTWYGYALVESDVIFVSPDTRHATLGIRGEPATANLGGISFPESLYRHDDSTISSGDEPVPLNVKDMSGVGAGWVVSLEATDFVWAQRPDGEGVDFGAISRSNLTVERAGELQMEAGDSRQGMLSVESPTNFEFPVPLLRASPTNGEGTYVLPLTFRIALPANTRPGDYTSTLTLTMSVSP